VSKATLTYAAFYPNWIHRIGGLQNIAVATVKRAQWLTEEVMDYSWEEHFEEVFQPFRVAQQSFLRDEKRKPDGQKRSLNFQQGSCRCGRFDSHRHEFCVSGIAGAERVLSCFSFSLSSLARERFC
jgi:hypothetical protein